MFPAAIPRSNITDGGLSAAAGSRRHERDRDRGTGKMPGPRTDGRQLPEMVAVPTDDEVPALEVLRACGSPAGVQDPDEVVRVQRPVRELPNDPLVGDRVPDRHLAVGAHETPPTGRRIGCRAEAGCRVDAGGRVEPGRLFDVSDSLACLATRDAPGRASDRRPPGSRWIAVSGRGVSGSRRASAAAARSPASSGAMGPPSAAREEPRDGPPVARELVQPGVLAALDHERLDVPMGAPRDLRQAFQMADRDHDVGSAMDEQDGLADGPERPARGDPAHKMATRPDVDPGGQPRQRPGDQAGQRQPGETERLPRKAPRIGRRRRRDHRRDPRLLGRREDRPDRPHRMAHDGPHRDLGAGVQRPEGGERVGAELAGRDRQRLCGVGAVAADIDHERVEAGRVEEDRHRQESVACGLPAVDQRDARPREAIAGGNEPAGQGQLARLDVDGLERQADVGRRDLWRPRDRVSRRARGTGRRTGTPARTGRRRARRGPRPGGLWARGYGTAGGPCQASLVAAIVASRTRAARRGRYNPLVAKRDPHDVLGIEPGASPTQIKAAWRRLARQHHPDLTGDDPAASRVATRLMAEINDAYAALTRPGGGVRVPRGRTAGTSGGTGAGAAGDAGPNGTRRGGPPRASPTRPVTARVDTTETIRPRNEPIRPGAQGASATAPTGPILRGQPPYRVPTEEREPPRASTPTGPAGAVAAPQLPPPGRTAARATRSSCELEFGKFHGHTLGQVAAFEPSYIDWLATTITRDPDLVAAARVVRDELDRRGVVRRARPAPAVAGSGRPA